MRCALLVDHDTAHRQRAAALLGSFGYLVAATDNAQTALHTAQTVRLDVILTDTAFNGDDRRGFISELGRLAPAAPVILMVDSGSGIPVRQDGCSAVLAKPVTLRALRRVLEFGIDGYGMQAARPAWTHERRRRPDRRHRSR